MNRKELLQWLGGGALAISGLEKLSTLPVMALESASNTLKLSAQALPLDATGLNGLSAKLIQSHHQNNYLGALKRLGLITDQLAQLNTTVPPFQVGSLKREELTAMNSVFLHELYFEQLGRFQALDGGLLQAINTQYGSFESWLQAFKHLALSLGGGSGWAILYYHPVFKRLQSVAASEHSVGLAGGQILLALDMYEHAYHMDYGADAKSYIEAFFRNLDWRVVANRYKAM